MIAIINVVNKNILFIGIASVIWRIHKPNQPVSGPGRIGKKEPIIPKQEKRKAMNSKNESINYF